MIGRREFIRRAAGLAAAGLGLPSDIRAGADASASASRPGHRRAGDTVVLGRTGIRTSRLAIGTGTKVCRQREMGQRGMLKLWRHGLDRGVRWWEVADTYGTHALVRSSLRQIPRDRVVITTKTMAKDFATARADIERFRQEMGTDYIDIVLLHCLLDPHWTTNLRGAMDAMSEAKSKGYIRAVGCSCHSFGALAAARDEPWGDVQLARINPFAVIMDVETPSEIPIVVEALQTMHDRGKGVYGMKILGEGQFQGGWIDASLGFALRQTCLDGFVIGFRSIEEFDDILDRIERLDVPA